MPKTPARKRFIISILIGIAFAMLYAWVSPREGLKIFDWQSLTFWAVVSNRILLGLVVAMAGTYRFHPIFGFRFPSFLRGIMIGIFVSIPLGFWEMIYSPELASKVFWFAIGSGAFYGAIIDLVATKIGGEDKELLV